MLTTFLAMLLAMSLNEREVVFPFIDCHTHICPSATSVFYQREDCDCHFGEPLCAYRRAPFLRVSPAGNNWQIASEHIPKDFASFGWREFARHANFVAHETQHSISMGKNLARQCDRSIGLSSLGPFGVTAVPRVVVLHRLYELKPVLLQFRPLFHKLGCVAIAQTDHNWFVNVGLIPVLT